MHSTARTCIPNGPGSSPFPPPSLNDESNAGRAAYKAAVLPLNYRGELKGTLVSGEDLRQSRGLAKGNPDLLLGDSRRQASLEPQARVELAQSALRGRCSPTGASVAGV